MTSYPILFSNRDMRRLRALSRIALTLAMVTAVTTATVLPSPRVSGKASGPGLNKLSAVTPARVAPAQPGTGQLVPASGDTCGTATVINPASLPFSEESSTIGAGNDVDPVGGCVPGEGPD